MSSLSLEFRKIKTIIGGFSSDLYCILPCDIENVVCKIFFLKLKTFDYDVGSQNKTVKHILQHGASSVAE